MYVFKVASKFKTQSESKMLKKIKEHSCECGGGVGAVYRGANV